MFIHSLTRGHLGGFQTVAITNKAAMNICVQVWSGQTFSTHGGKREGSVAGLECSKSPCTSAMRCLLSLRENPQHRLWLSLAAESPGGEWLIGGHQSETGFF